MQPDKISIHAPLAGRDYTYPPYIPPKGGFQSTRPSRGATDGMRSGKIIFNISIHAPLAGRDQRRRGISGGL